MVRLIKTAILIICSTILMAQPLVFDVEYFYTATENRQVEPDWINVDSTKVIIEGNTLIMEGVDTYSELTITDKAKDEDFKREYIRLKVVDTEDNEVYNIIIFFPDSDGIYWRMLLRGEDLETGFLMLEQGDIW